MFFRKRRKESEPVNPSIVNVRWIVLGFLVVALISNYSKNHTFLPSKSAEEIKTSIVKAAPGAPMNFSSINSLLPVSTPAMSIKDVQDGQGSPAVCGQKVSIAYTTATIDEKTIKDSAGKDHPLSFRIGGHKVMPALEKGIVGMRKGGKRLVFAPANDAYDAKGFIRDDVAKNTRVAFNVELLDVSPPLPPTKDSAFRISTMQNGNGHALLCGNEAKILLTVWNIEGKKIFPSAEGAEKPITFIPGKSQVFLALEQGVIGMNVGGKRSLIVPPEFQKTMDGNQPDLHIPFPPKQTVLVEVEAMP